MAKNLKLNVKNAQLAEALKKLKSPTSAPAKAELPAKKEAASAPSSAQPAPVEAASSKPKKVKSETAISTPVEEKAPAARPEKEVATPKKLDAIETSPAKEEKPPASASTEPKAPEPKAPPRLGYPPRPGQTTSSYRPPERSSTGAPSYPPRPSYSSQGNYPPRNNSGPSRSYSDNSGPPRDRYPSSRPPYNNPNSAPNSRPPQGNYSSGGGYQGNSPRPPRPPGSAPYGSPRPNSYGPRPAGSYSNANPGNSGAPGGYRPNSYGPRPPGNYTPRPPGSYGSSGPGGYRPGPRPPYTGAPRPGFPPSNRPSAFPSKEPRRGDGIKRPAPKGPEADRASAFKDIKNYRKPDSYKSFDSRDRQGLRGDEDSQIWRKKRKAIKGMMIQEEIIRPKSLKVRIPITIKDLAAEMKLKASQLISSLFMKGVVLTLNDALDDETTIQLLGQDFDCTITIDTSEEERLKITDKTIKQEIEEAREEDLILRSPVVTFMGHVDHGKTSLIDAIRKSDIASGEAGAITQHIGAFKCHTAVGALTILDTPGHEAFSAMRARGADVTDLVVLVIAGDEGIRAQTLEALNQAKEANVPMMVAINKSDKPGFNAENIYRQLSEQSLLPEAWGGQTITVNCSALTGEGIKELLEMLALQAEVLELKANPQTRARGTVVESQMHKGMGAVATILVQNGTLHRGDAVVFDEHWGRVKTMHDEHGKELAEAGPSTPVKITGLSDLPEAGSEFIVVASEKEARSLSEDRQAKQKSVALQVKKGGLENLLQQQATKQEKKMLALILRADVQGSLEALKQSLEKIESTKATINIVSAEVGEISESDIELAGASKAVIIGFHTQIESRADSLIKELKVKVRLHDIIYHAVDDVKEILVSLLDKVAQENDIGEVHMKALFKSSQLGSIAGCQVASGTIRRNSHVRLVRDKEVIWKGPLASLKRGKEDTREVSKGQECGILLQGFSAVKEGDILQVYDITYLTQEL